METTQVGSNDSGECKRKVMGLEEKSMTGYDTGRFLCIIGAFCLDDFRFCNSSKLGTVGGQSKRKLNQIKSNYEFSLISILLCPAGRNVG